jgi:hypothetical protein
VKDVTCSGLLTHVPHSGQNTASSGTLLPQLLQNIVCSSFNTQALYLSGLDFGELVCFSDDTQKYLVNGILCVMFGFRHIKRRAVHCLLLIYVYQLNHTSLFFELDN